MNIKNTINQSDMELFRNIKRNFGIHITKEINSWNISENYQLYQSGNKFPDHLILTNLSYHNIISYNIISYNI